MNAIGVLGRGVDLGLGQRNFLLGRYFDLAALGVLRAASQAGPSQRQFIPVARRGGKQIAAAPSYGEHAFVLLQLKAGLARTGFC